MQPAPIPRGFSAHSVATSDVPPPPAATRRRRRSSRRRAARVSPPATGRPAPATPRDAGAPRRGRVDEGRATREALILSAERLVAESGPAALSLREVGARAGQKNHSTVQYHFGSKVELLHAIFRHRLPGVNARRLELLAGVGGDDLRSLIRCEVTTFAELADREDVHYVPFLARMFQSAEFDLIFERLAEPELIEGQMQIRRRIARRLQGVPRGVVDQRLWLALTQIVYGLAERRAMSRRMGPAWTIPIDAWVANYVDYAAAALAAPVSDESRRLGDFRLGRIGRE